MLPPLFIFHLLVYISLLQTDENYRKVCSGSEAAKVEADGLMLEAGRGRHGNKAQTWQIFLGSAAHSNIITASSGPRQRYSLQQAERVRNWIRTQIRTRVRNWIRARVRNRVRTMKTCLVQLSSSFSSKSQTVPEIQQI